MGLVWCKIEFHKKKRRIREFVLYVLLGGFIYFWFDCLCLQIWRWWIPPCVSVHNHRSTLLLILVSLLLYSSLQINQSYMFTLDDCFLPPNLFIWERELKLFILITLVLYHYILALVKLLKLFVQLSVKPLLLLLLGRQVPWALLSSYWSSYAIP